LALGRSDKPVVKNLFINTNRAYVLSMEKNGVVGGYL
jgi:hypothetical protein